MYIYLMRGTIFTLLVCGFFSRTEIFPGFSLHIINMMGRVVGGGGGGGVEHRPTLRVIEPKNAQDVGRTSQYYHICR
jgi:hypothetical protein